jgi:hypothetical protein
MDRPSPVPLYRFVAEASNWVNGEKSDSTANFWIPIPVSVTSVRIVNEVASSSTSDTWIPIEPDSVNLTALEIRF